MRSISLLPTLYLILLTTSASPSLARPATSPSHPSSSSSFDLPSLRSVLHPYPLRRAPLPLVLVKRQGSIPSEGDGDGEGESEGEGEGEGEESSSTEEAATAAAALPTGVLDSGDAIPSVCQSGCAGTESLISSCESDESTCTQLCPSDAYTAAVACLNCLVANGADSNLASTALGEIGTLCDTLASGVEATGFITASATATGPFTSLSAGAGSVSANATATASATTTPHTGLTLYDSTTRLPSTTAPLSTSLAVNPSATQTGAAGRAFDVRMHRWTVFLGVGAVGTMLL